jgi:hypothetical protein
MVMVVFDDGDGLLEHSWECTRMVVVRGCSDWLAPLAVVSNGFQQGVAPAIDDPGARCRGRYRPIGQQDLTQAPATGSEQGRKQQAQGQPASATPTTTGARWQPAAHGAACTCSVPAVPMECTP